MPTVLLAVLCAAPAAAPQWLGPKPPAVPKRVVTLAPSLTATVLALGRRDALVGVSRFDEAPEVAQVKRVGGFNDPSVEAVVALKADLVLVQMAPANQKPVEKMAELGIPVLALPLTTVQDTLDATLRIGEALGVPDAGKAVVARITKARDEVRARAKARKPVRVLLVYGFQPLVVAGPGSFAHELMTDCGAVNVAEAAPTAYPVFSPERALAAKPDVVFDGADVDTGKDTLVALLKTPRWVKPKAKDLLQPGPFLDRGLLELEALLFPEAAPLSMANVEEGDLVEYDVDGRGALTVRACAKSGSTVTLAVSLATKEKRFPALLDGVLIEQPIAPMKPAPQLPQPETVGPWKGAGGAWETCGVWKRPFSMHGVNGEERRCEGRELILGGGLVQETASQFTVRGGGFSHQVTLKRFARTPGPCPKWPRATVSGTYRTLEEGGMGESAIDHAYASSGSWVRRTEYRSSPTSTYLLDLLIDLARDRMDGELQAMPSEWKLGGRTVPTFQTRAAETVTHWAAPDALPDAPLAMRARPLSTETVSGKRKTYERVVQFGLADAGR